jgi:hypothetical protein
MPIERLGFSALVLRPPLNHLLDRSTRDGNLPIASVEITLLDRHCPAPSFQALAFLQLPSLLARKEPATPSN